MEYDIYRYPCLKEFSLFSMKQVFKTTLGDVIKTMSNITPLE